MTAFKPYILPHIPQRSEKGFTLLEIMVSIAVLALVMVTLFRLQSGTIKLADHGKFNSLAPFLARQQLAALERELDSPPRLTGAFGDDYQGYEWSAVIKNADFEEPAIISEKQFGNFKRIDLEITYSNKGRSYKITSWRYQVENEDN